MKVLVRRQFVMFVCIGLGATAVHVGIATHLIGNHMMPPALGNAIAFVFANLFSYFFHSAYVFQRSPTRAQYWRFLSVSVGGLAIAVGISSALEALGVHYLMGVCAVVLTLPIVTFTLHNVWTFRDAKGHTVPLLNHSGRAGRWTV